MNRRELSALSILFEYPGPLHDAAATRFSGFSRYWEATSPERRREVYVETFDFSKDVSLYLTYPVLGDTRERGVALARLKYLYRAAGFESVASELPDFLPLVLDFSARAERGPAQCVLHELRPGIEALRRALRAKHSPYSALTDSLCAMIPRATSAQQSIVNELERNGPPTELVGR